MANLIDALLPAGLYILRHRSSGSPDPDPAPAAFYVSPDTPPDLGNWTVAGTGILTPTGNEVSVDDPALVTSFVVSDADTNGLFDFTGFTAVTELTFSNTPIPSLDFTGATNVESVSVNSMFALATLEGTGTGVQSVTVENCPSLTSIDVDGNPDMTLIEVLDCPSLTDLSAVNTPSLTQYSVENVAMTSLNLISASLTSILLVSPPLNSITLDCPNLTSLTFAGCTSLGSLDFTGFGSLILLNMNNCASMTSLNVSGLTSLATVYVEGCGSLATLNISGCSGLVSLYYDPNMFLSLTSFNANGASLASAVLDEILYLLATFGLNDGFLDLRVTNDEVPTDFASISTLKNHSWTVHYNTP